MAIFRFELSASSGGKLGRDTPLNVTNDLLTLFSSLHFLTFHRYCRLSPTCIMSYWPVNTPADAAIMSVLLSLLYTGAGPLGTINRGLTPDPKFFALCTWVTTVLLFKVIILNLFLRWLLLPQADGSSCRLGFATDGPTVDNDRPCPAVDAPGIAYAHQRPAPLCPADDSPVSVNDLPHPILTHYGTAAA